MVTKSPNDLVLPQYFYSQLTYLSNDNYVATSNIASQLLNSLQQVQGCNVLVFKNQENNQIYFIDQELIINYLGSNSNQIDLTIPLNRYLITLYYYARLLKSQVYFLPLSHEITYQCLNFNFKVANTEDLLIPDQSWLTPELVQKIQTKLDPKSKIKWQNSVSSVSDSVESIKWLNF